MKFKRGDLDIRSNKERIGCTETVCDECAEVILESELRWTDKDGDIICDSCHDAVDVRNEIRGIKSCSHLI